MKESHRGNEVDSGHKKRRDSDASPKQSMKSSFISVSSKMLSGMKLSFRNRPTNRASEAGETTPPSSPPRSRLAGSERKKSVSSSATNSTLPPTSSPSPSSERSMANLPSATSETRPPSCPSPIPESTEISPESPSSDPTQVTTAESEEIPPPSPADLDEELDENTEGSIPSSGSKEPLSRDGPTGGITTKNQEYFKKMREVPPLSLLAPPRLASSPLTILRMKSKPSDPKKKKSQSSHHKN
jgi:hypothetical protein